MFGEFSPEGKLPITFYRTTEELPAFTDYAMQNRTYRYMKNDALYPFGYGLTYTSFEITNVEISSEVASKEGVDITLDISNTGNMDARETVQVYVKAERECTPNAGLKAFKKVALSTGETKQVIMHLGLEAFSLCDEEGKRVVLPGTYSIYIGDSQPDKRSVELTHKVPHCVSIAINEYFELS